MTGAPDAPPGAAGGDRARSAAPAAGREGPSARAATAAPEGAGPGTSASATAAPEDAARAGRAPRRARTAWYAVAAVSAALVLVPVASWAVSRQARHQEALAGGSGAQRVRAVEIEVDDASVSVTPGSGGAVDYRGTARWFGQRPTVEQSLLGDVLRLTARCSDGGLPLVVGPGCSLDLAVTVPKGVPVRVESASGPIGLSGLTGPVDARSASGEVRLYGLGGPVRAEVGSGTVRATALTSAQAEVRVGSGSAVVGFAAPPGSVTGTADSGSLHVTLPPGVRYRVRCTAGSGTCTVSDALRDPRAAGVLRLSADSGSADADYAE
ncbi:hypothetical protein [Streptomyces sp. NPDC093225]|uniref:hypothetical protein n=1 Tax=Streptomyces sp. NPDC093225 TaxID=3366034 RepID=UPI0037F3324E